MQTDHEVVPIDRRQHARINELILTPSERVAQAAQATDADMSSAKWSATLWADNPHVTFSLPLLFQHVGIALEVVHSSETCLQAARVGSPHYFLVLDCVTAVDGWDRCAAILTQTTALVLICHQREEFVTDVKRLARGPIEWLPAAYTGLPLFVKLRTRMAMASPASGPHAGEGDGYAHSALTARENAVYQLVVAHLSNAQIAARLGVTENTVKKHVAAIMTKLNLHRRIDLIARSRAGQCGQTECP